jgi:hypothetical protein
MEPHALLASLLHVALDRGLRCALFTGGERALDDWCINGTRPTGEVVHLRVDGRHLHGPLADIYVHEIASMMSLCPLVEWAGRAEWIARMLPIYPVAAPLPELVEVGAQLAARARDFTLHCLGEPVCDLANGELEPGQDLEGDVAFLAWAGSFDELDVEDYELLYRGQVPETAAAGS